MTKDTIITANFERIIYSLTVLSGIGGNASEGGNIIMDTMPPCLLSK